MEVQSGYHTNTSDQGSMEALKPTALQTMCPEAGLHEPGRSGAFSLHKYSLVDTPRKMLPIASTLRQLHAAGSCPAASI